jgi:hypothetical protein
MPDVTLPSGLVKPAVGSTSYGAKWNTNWDLMDGLFNRVSTLESLHGADVPNYWLVPSGSTWAATQAIIDAAQAAYATGGMQTVVLPNETIIQTATCTIRDAPVTLTGSGPLSNLKVTSDLTLFGSGMQFFIGGQDAGPALPGPIILRDFIIEHDRATVVRMNGIDIGQWLRGLYLQNLTFKTITASCIAVVTNPSIAARSEGLRVLGCTANEFYESFVDDHQGSIHDFAYIGNTCATSTANPNGSISSPYGINIDLEAGGEGVVDVGVIQNNSFTFTGTAQGNVSNPSLGVSLNFSQGVIQWRYDRIAVKDNHIVGPYYGIYIGATYWPTHQNDLTDPDTEANFRRGSGAYNEFTGNLVEGCVGEQIYMHPTDVPSPVLLIRYIVANNELVTTGAQVGLNIDMTNSPGAVINFGSANPLADNNIHA